MNGAMLTERPAAAPQSVLLRRPLQGGWHALSFGQRRIWILDLLLGPNAVYNIPLAFEIRGELDCAAFERAFRAMAERHEIFRTTYEAVDGTPRALVAAGGPRLRAPVQDLSALRAGVREAAGADLLAAGGAEPFDLARGPLLRARFLRLAPREHVLLLVFHHITFDGRSKEVFWRDMAALYEAARGGEAPRLEPPAFQYSDFAAWQAEHWTEEALVPLVASWKARLAELSPLLLPADRPRRATPGHHGARHSVSAPLALVEAARARARAEGVTLFTVLAAAFSALLFRSTGQPDVAFGVPVSGRRPPETESIMGFFVNTVVLRTRLDGGEAAGGISGRELFVRLHASRTAAFAEQDLPFERLAEEMPEARESGLNPFFEVIFSLDRAPRWKPRLGDLEVVPTHVGVRAVKVDLALSVLEAESGLTGYLDYRSELFDASTAERFYQHFLALLAALAHHPERPIGTLDLLSRAARHQVQCEWNDLRELGPGELGAQELFAAAAERAPDSIAVVEEGLWFSYGELRRTAQRVASGLLAGGIGPEGIVGLTFERGFELVVAEVACLSAGASFALLDASYPRERLEAVLADLGFPPVLCHDPVPDLLAEVGANALPLPRVLGAIREPLGAGCGPESSTQAAYLIYTSGSTGVPKAVVVPHGGLANLVRWHLAAFELAPGDRTSLLAGVAFDASVWEIWSALAAGAVLEVPSAAVKADPALLAAWFVERAIRSAFVPTPLAEELLRQTWPEGAALSTLLTGGDRLHAPPPPGTPFVLFNNYGPTENSVVATSGPVAPRSGAGRAPSIGRPITNARVRVLSRALEPAPIGVAGELAISGPGLARGYHRRPALTAERFVPSPAPLTPGERLYRTGDLVRWLPEGTIEFLGRIDQQVKLRGLRVELDEITATLGRHPEVDAAVVVVRREPASEPSLLAYWVALPGHTPPAEELRSFLRLHLPAHMVPGVFVRLEALPLNSSGKVNRKALPAPGREDLPSAAEWIPQRWSEEVVAGFWRELLPAPVRSAHDDFFELGGHSLLLLQVARRIEEAIGVRIGIAELFAHPVLADLATLIERRRLGEAGSEAEEATFEVAPVAGPSALSFHQERLWFLDRLHPGRSPYVIARAWEVRGDLDPARLIAGVAAVAARHTVLRSSFHDVDGVPRAVAELPWAPELVVVDCSRLGPDDAQATAERVLAGWVKRPFSLAEDRLVRLAVVPVAPRRRLVALALHHIVADGGSLDILLRELSLGYRDREALAALPVPGAQYSDFVRWQRNRLTAERAGSLAARWTAYLDGMPRVLELPAPLARPRESSPQGACRRFLLDAPLAEAMAELCRRRGVTLFMLVLAAFQLLLARYTGRRRMLVGSPVGGRERGEVEGAIGFFVNTLVIAGDLTGSPSFGDLLVRARQTVLTALDLRDLPFDQIVAAAVPERRTGVNPLFQVMLAVEQGAERNLELAGASCSPVELDPGFSQVDLTLDVRPAGAGLGVWCEYSTELFDAAWIERLIGHFRTLLRAGTATPERQAFALELLSAAELSEALLLPPEPCGGALDVASVERRVRAQADRAPEAIAVVESEEHLSYRELCRRSTALAWALRCRGIGAEVAVALASERSTGLVTALLGVLEAGGAFLVLDPALPHLRRELMLADVAAHLTLGPAELAALLAEPAPSWEPQGAPGEALAYAIFTSGSTGRPKGVAVSHRALALACASAVEVLELTAADRVVVSASFAFDVALEQTLPALTVGATLVLWRELPWGSDGLAEALVRDAVTVADLPMSYLHQLVSEASLGASLRSARPRLITAGGEEMPRTLLERWAAAWAEPPELLNAYGPTEATITATARRFSRAFALDLGPRPGIGRPLFAIEALVVDVALNPVPQGVPGELLLGGERLARGYLGRPAETAAAFIPDAGSGAAGARMYRTGDLVELGRDGELRFLGRINGQVKVRGYRIELGEIEEVLREHPAIAACAVVVEQGEAEPRLAAHIVAAPRADIEPPELITWLCQRLPSYMVPDLFGTLPALPLTTSGKVDRRALPPLGMGAASRSAHVRETSAAPQTALERVLAEIWQGVLGVDGVTLDDDFFTLGGQSLKVMQVLSRLKKILKLELNPQALFEAPTVRLLTASLERDAARFHRLRRAAELWLELKTLSAPEVLARLERSRQQESIG